MSFCSLLYCIQKCILLLKDVWKLQSATLLKYAWKNNNNNTDARRPFSQHWTIWFDKLISECMFCSFGLKYYISLYRKLAKSTLVLVLVFGIHYIIFVGMPHTFQGPSWEMRMYFELFFNSFQVLGLSMQHAQHPGSSRFHQHVHEVSKKLLEKWFSWLFNNLFQPVNVILRLCLSN